MHDPLNTYDLVHDELLQRQESGYDVTEAANRFANTSPKDSNALEEIYEQLTLTHRDPAWPYEEPETLVDILDSMPGPATADPLSAVTLPGEDLDNRILGSWLGRIAGCNLGKPIEDGDHWTTSHIRAYLELADAYPLRDYIPAVEPMPDAFRFKNNWVHTTKGRVNGSDRDDDIDYPIMGLHMMETHGPDLTPAQIAATWLAYIPYLRLFTAERAAYVNLLRNVPLETLADTRNPYREWIGALIRGDIFGWTSPGQPRRAATRAYQDASFTHRANGVYGEMWATALVSSALTAATIREAFNESLNHVPPRSRLAEALRHVRDMHQSDLTWEAAIDSLQERYGHYSWVHTVNNAAVIAAGLLWGDEDYSAVVGLTVQGGWDTDSNGATAGSVAGAVLGAQRLPGHFIEPLQDRTRSAVFGYDNSRISDLAARTTKLALHGTP